MESRKGISSHLGLTNCMYLHPTADVRPGTRTRNYSLQTQLSY